MIGGFLSMNVGWRWVERLLAALGGLAWVLPTVTVPETHASVLLHKRAQRLAQITGKHYRSQINLEKGDTSFLKRLRTTLSRPWILLFCEPIVLLFTLYASVVYGTLYMLFAAFPIVYEEGRGWNPGVAGLPFLGVMIGVLLGAIYTVYDNRRYKKPQEEYRGLAPPELRLPPCMLAGIVIPISLFWFAWTNSATIHWMASVAAMVPFGVGILLIYLSIVDYLLDCYTIFAASLLAAMSILRYFFGAALPLLTTHMYRALGIHWASSIPAFLSLLCLPLPFFFHRYGPSVRKRCRYAAQAQALSQHLQLTEAVANVPEHDGCPSRPGDRGGDDSLAITRAESLIT